MNLFKIKNHVSFENWYTIQTFLSRILTFGIGLLFKIVLARILTVEENGIFGKWLAIFNYGIIAFSFGLNLSMIYFAKKGQAIINNFLGNVLSYSILLFIGLLVLAFFPNKAYYFSLCLAIFISLISSSLNGVQLSNNKITLFNITELVRSIFIFILCLTSIYIFSYNKLEILYISYTIALLVTFVIFLFFIDFSKSNLKKIKLPNANYIKFGLKGTILNVLSQSLYIVDVFIVSYIAGPRYLGIYIVASSIARLLWFFVDAAGTVIFPRLVSSENESNSRSIIYKLSTFSFVISILGFLFFLLLGKQIIPLTFGVEYLEGFNTIIVLMLASPGMIFFKLINRFLAAQNEWVKSYIAISISLLVNVLLNFYLIREYNIIGAAFASFISYWLCGFIMAKTSRFNVFSLMFTRNLLK